MMPAIGFFFCDFWRHSHLSDAFKGSLQDGCCISPPSLSLHLSLCELLFITQYENMYFQCQKGRFESTTRGYWNCWWAPYVDPKDPTTSSSTSGTSTVTSTTTSTSATTSTISTASVSITTTGTSATQSTTTSTAFTSTAAATATTATTASTSTITETITTATVTTITATGSISSSTSEHGSSSQENLNTTTETMTTSSSLVWLSNQMGQIFKSMKLESLGRSNEWQQLDHHLSFFIQQKARAGFCIDRGRNQT